ncbi:hypothetical protein KI387_001141 [Taxus chinensis]|uniref:UspA domain-containing protein n=1 Tax=Taxus chinensis TaxID=29808 RepID=A0AA38GU83_TAXCH|nr:hypothetical protein KI387_001141 [Taxus chinensis]
MEVGKTESIPMEEENQKRVILVGMDGSRESTHALQWVLQDFCTEPYNIIIIHAQPTASRMTRALAAYFRKCSRSLKTFEEGVKKNTEDIFARAMKECTEKNVAPELKAVTGDARNVLCKAVEQYSAEMLVLGSHENGFTKRLLCRSVIDHCAHHARCFVALVKKKGAWIILN